ncbi:Glutathione S-transferase 3 [Orchesella cincta]|uniref:Glutathione S-transferase 3 n=1 Tax=Orchesella cincta TaxID=48709 RepID=A0A1D2N9E8_ORCCI|nr:Glutathione S-transferase 3 [Orchesella cincta]
MMAENTDGRKYKLIYYNVRGLAEPVRWMFKMAKVEFEDKRIPVENWQEEKHRFEKQMGRLPILCVDDKIELTQVASITQFVAKQLGFNGETEMDAARADEVHELLYDLRLYAANHLKSEKGPSDPDIFPHTVFRNVCNEANLSKKVLMKRSLLYIFPKYLDKINDVLQQSPGEYLAGQRITYADLAFTNFIDICEEMINPDLLNDYPCLRDLKEEILDIPEIREWMEHCSTKSFYPPTVAA